MKQVTLIVYIIFSGLNCFGQEIKKGDNYYINNSRNWNEISTLKVGEVKSESSKELLKGKNYKLKVRDVTKEKVYFKFWYFSKKDSLQHDLLNGNNKDKVFNMPLVDFQKMTEVYYNLVEWRVGIFTVPFKIRLDDFAFSSNVNLGTSISAKFRTNRKNENPMMIEPLLSIGAAGIKLDNENATITQNTPTSLFALSLTGGLLIHISKNINTGLFLGVDKLSKNDQAKVNWKHDGNLWLGIGFNVNFANGNKNNSSDNNQSI